VREARAAKLRKGVGNLAGDAQVVLSGVGALEVAEHRAFIGGVVDGLRVVGGSKEAARREREERQGGYDGADEDEDML
jgi:GINS complex subunit 2